MRLKLVDPFVRPLCLLCQLFLQLTDHLLQFLCLPLSYDQVKNRSALTKTSSEDAPGVKFGGVLQVGDGGVASRLGDGRVSFAASSPEHSAEAQLFWLSRFCKEFRES